MSKRNVKLNYERRNINDYYKDMKKDIYFYRIKEIKNKIMVRCYFLIMKLMGF